MSRQAFYKRLDTIARLLDVDFGHAETITSLHAAPHGTRLHEGAAQTVAARRVAGGLVMLSPPPRFWGHSVAWKAGSTESTLAP